MDPDKHHFINGGIVCTEDSIIVFIQNNIFFDEALYNNIGIGLAGLRKTVFICYYCFAGILKIGRSRKQN